MVLDEVGDGGVVGREAGEALGREAEVLQPGCVGIGVPGFGDAEQGWVLGEAGVRDEVEDENKYL